MGGILPFQIVCHDEFIDGIYRPVEYHGIDLGNERTYQCKDECEYN
jgi:hypothetical protein